MTAQPRHRAAQPLNSRRGAGAASVLPVPWPGRWGPPIPLPAVVPLGERPSCSSNASGHSPALLKIPSLSQRCVHPSLPATGWRRGGESMVPLLSLRSWPPPQHPGIAPGLVFGACQAAAGSSHAAHVNVRAQSLCRKNFAVPDLILVAFIGAAREERDESSNPGRYGRHRSRMKLLCFPSSLLRLLWSDALD